jgi:hypothetical protein
MVAALPLLVVLTGAGLRMLLLALALPVAARPVRDLAQAPIREARRGRGPRRAAEAPSPSERVEET